MIVSGSAGLEGEGGVSSAQTHRGDGSTSSLGYVSISREQCVVAVSSLKREDGRGSLAQHHRTDGQTSSLGHEGMGQ